MELWSNACILQNRRSECTGDVVELAASQEGTEPTGVVKQRACVPYHQKFTLCETKVNEEKVLVAFSLARAARYPSAPEFAYCTVRVPI
jgi:hypothetical protein